MPEEQSAERAEQASQQQRLQQQAPQQRTPQPQVVTQAQVQQTPQPQVVAQAPRQRSPQPQVTSQASQILMNPRIMQNPRIQQNLAAENEKEFLEKHSILAQIVNILRNNGIVKFIKNIFNRNNVLAPVQENTPQTPEQKTQYQKLIESPRYKELKEKQKDRQIAKVIYSKNDTFKNQLKVILDEGMDSFLEQRTEEEQKTLKRAKQEAIKRQDEKFRKNYSKKSRDIIDNENEI